MGCLGHSIFFFLHAMAVLFGFVFLFVTIPLHVVASVAGRK